jgi:hypothetical protein
MVVRVTIQFVLLSLCVTVLILASVLDINPQATEQVTLGSWTLPEFCQSKRLFRIDCPGCGMTRSFIYMAHGEVPAAFKLHPTGAILFIAMILAIPFLVINAVWISRGNRSLIGDLGISVLVLISTVMLMLQWLIRFVLLALYA